MNYFNRVPKQNESQKEVQVDVLISLNRVCVRNCDGNILIFDSRVGNYKL